MSGFPTTKQDSKDKCPVCAKRVYAAERISAEASGDIYHFHKSCFRCVACNCVLKPGGYATEGKKFFCKPHLPRASSKIRAPINLTPIIVETVQQVVLSPTSSTTTDHDNSSPRIIVSQPAEIKSALKDSPSSSPPIPSAHQPSVPVFVPSQMASPSAAHSSPVVPVPGAPGTWSPPAASSPVTGTLLEDSHSAVAAAAAAAAVVPPLQIGRKNTRSAEAQAPPDRLVLTTSGPLQQLHSAASETQTYPLVPPPVQPQPRSLKDWLQTAPSAAKLAQLQTMKLEALQREAKRDKDKEGSRSHVVSPNRDAALANGSSLSQSTSNLPLTEPAVVTASNADKPAVPAPKRAMMSPIRIRSALPDALKNHNASPARPDMMSPRGLDEGEMFSPRLEETQLRSSRDPSTPAIVQDVATLRTELTKAQKDARSLKKEVRKREEDLKQLRRDMRDQIEALNQLRTFVNQLDSEKHLLAVEAKVLAQEAKQFAIEARQLALEASRAKDEAAQARREATEVRQELTRLQQRVLDVESRPVASLPPAHATAAVAAAAVGRARGDATNLMARALENDVAQAQSARSPVSAATTAPVVPTPTPTPAPSPAPVPIPSTSVAPVFTPAYPPPKSSAGTLKKSDDDPSRKLAAPEFTMMKKISSEDLANIREQNAGRKVRDFYEIGKRLAKGGQSIVFLGTQKATGKKVAIKKIKRTADKEEEDALWREISLLKTLSHPNIVKFYEFFEEENFMYLIMEYIDGKELFEKIIEKGAYSERDAAVVVRQIVDAIAYMHANHIAHRDVKPENILSSGSGSSEIVKLADFGLSKNFDAGPLQTLCGSSLYIAPELLNDSKYDNSVDLWSLGVVVYILLCGQSPWKSPPTEANKLLQDIINCRWDFEKEEWKHISAEAKDFIARLLRKEPAERMTAAQCLAHPWLQPAGSKTAALSHKQLNNTLTRLKDFTYGRKTAKSLLDLFDPPTAAKDDA